MNGVHPSLLKRKIIHVDMDAFYAAVEVRDNPELAGMPLVIGGSPQSRAVVCTASYEARRFGIRSAMSCAKAYRLCRDAVFLPPNFEKYARVSQQIRDIFARYTQLIEPLSLDEAFLDVTNNDLGLYAVQIGKKIQEAVASELQLSCSVGVAPNKLVAKIASDWRKPGGLTAVPPEKVAEFMKALEVRKLFGVGPATEKRLHSLGIRTCEDVLAKPFDELEARLGSFAAWIFHCAQGIDERRVHTSRKRKSIGREETFSEDLTNLPRLLDELALLAKKISRDLGSRGMTGRTLTLKVKYHDFDQITRSQTLSVQTDSESEIFEVARQLLLEKTEAGLRRIRLLGLSLSNLQRESQCESETGLFQTADDVHDPVLHS
ncbi:MAG: DNA polymerase IV [Silvanigrellaceae bacterium]